MSPSLDAIGIVTVDLERSLAFYRLLGLDIPDVDGGHVEATLPNGLRLMWDTVEVVRSFDPTWQPATGGPGQALAFLCANAVEVDTTVEALAANGFTVARPPWDAPWGQRYATVVDPDGNHVDLFAALSG